MSPQTLRAKAQVRLGPEEGPEFQIAPMIDILLVLLVFFMSISSTEVLQVRNNVVLPVAQGKEQRGDGGQALVNVTWSFLDHSGAVEIDGQRFQQLGQMRNYLRSRTSANPDLRVLIRADREVRYDFLRPLLIATGEAGVRKITFAVVDQNLPLIH